MQHAVLKKNMSAKPCSVSSWKVVFLLRIGSVYIIAFCWLLSCTTFFVYTSLKKEFFQAAEVQKVLYKYEKL